MRTFGKIVVGCLLAPIVLGIVLVITGLALRRASPMAHHDEQANLDQPVTAVTPAQLASEGLQVNDSAPAGRPLPVALRLEEGNFTIAAGPVGSDIRVEGNFDAGAYELKHEMVKDAQGGPSYKLSFLPRYSLFHRLLTEGGVHIDKDDNKITVYLPRGIPMSLTAQIRKGSSHLNLGGLALDQADLEFSMGEHSLTVDESNPLEMSTLKLDTSMGESRVEDLGNLRAGSIEVWSKMGETRIDFGEKLARDTKLYARMKMGELVFTVPHEAKVKKRTTMFLGDTNGKLTEEGEGPVLDIETLASFGDVKFRRH